MSVERHAHLQLAMNNYYLTRMLVVTWIYMEMLKKFIYVEQADFPAMDHEWLILFIEFCVW